MIGLIKFNYARSKLRCKNKEREVWVQTLWVRLNTQCEQRPLRYLVLAKGFIFPST